RRQLLSTIKHLVAGGDVSTTNQNISINLTWYTATVHVVYVWTWLDEMSSDEQQKLTKHVTKQVEIL
ncbi:unnamed protein product, partial [Rotaria sp. Silwood2]